MRRGVFAVNRFAVLCGGYAQGLLIAVNAVANHAGMPPGTVYSVIGPKSKNPGVVTLHEICDGLGISLREFFDSSLFDDLERVNL